MSRLICGRKPVDELFVNKCKIKKMYLLKNNHDWDRKAHESDFRIIYQDHNFFEANFPSMNHQNIAVEIEDYKYYDFSEVLTSLKVEENPTIVILDSIEDPGNFGAIIRTCVATDVKAIIIRKDNQVKVTPTVVKTSSGYVEKIKIVIVPNLINAINLLKKKGFWVISTTLKPTIDYKKIDYKMPTVLVIGNESNGISKLVLENSDYKVALPMENDVNSLNASVSAGIMLYEIYLNKKG